MFGAGCIVPPDHVHLVSGAGRHTAGQSDCFHHRGVGVVPYGVSAGSFDVTEDKYLSHFGHADYFTTGQNHVRAASWLAEKLFSRNAPYEGTRFCFSAWLAPADENLRPGL